MEEGHGLGELLSQVRADQKAVEQQKQPFYSHAESVMTVEKGSFLGRTLEGYREILAHNGAPDFVEYAKKIESPTIVDAGCGAATALLDLRDALPNSRLVGIDNRDVSRNTLVTPAGIKIGNVGELTRRHNVELNLDSFANVGKILPEGYDVLLSVGAFNGSDFPEMFQRYLTNLFYKGLRPNGIAQMLIDTERIDGLGAILDAKGVPWTFNPGDPSVLRNNGFGDQMGTLTLGPKT